MKVKFPLKKTHLHHALKSIFWFSVGSLLGLFLLVSFAFIFFERKYQNYIYPGISIGAQQFGGKTKEDVQKFFEQKNEKIADTALIFTAEGESKTISAGEIDFGYNTNLLSLQAISIGRSENILSNIYLIFQSYINGIMLSPSFSYSEEKLEAALLPLSQKIKKDPIDALFNFHDGKVSAFRLSSDGQDIDIETLKKDIVAQTYAIISENRSQSIIFRVPIKTVKPKVTTEEVNKYGIKEIIGTGTSLFQGSIPSRIYNITLAATRLNGILIPPGEIFSFNKSLGDVSAFTGYKQAYVIQNGRTVLGDGGGVCQVSTTFFRALLNAGLPIVERYAHAYRVGYYEQDSPPGLDATIYVPTVDLKFKNDTGNHILVQTYLDPNYQRLTFALYGTKDGRDVSLTKPIITSQSAPPEPLYQDDPSLPKGVIKQIDFAASGAKVSFSRQVTKNGKVIISETFASSYRPWQAVYLRGTQE